MIQLAVLAVVFLIILPAWIIYKPPRSLINYFARRFPDVLFHINTADKIVALTIDDTPSAYTKDILALLESNNATATFFVIGGQIHGEEQKAILVDIVRQGSELGNHAMHDEPSVSLASDVLESEIAEVDRFIEQAYQQAGEVRQQRWFRPGSGFFSRRILNIAAAAEYTTALGDIFPHDPIISSWRINAWHILSSLRPGGIIIIHDRRSWTVPLLRKILPAMRRKGYEVVSASRALEIAEGKRRQGSAASSSGRPP
ncbi:hypothetical protein AMS68_000218 [Peltaster fructicola]|uniref:chitin deacetylase n=1 Tax=Peltaster fructicola TaxID=286661 RepID=A0A6H0XJ86_9PEZI|nr:hypothetical protein AMS68_000218 [Peltaster fructicola]